MDEDLFGDSLEPPVLHDDEVGESVAEEPDAEDRPLASLGVRDCFCTAFGHLSAILRGHALPLALPAAPEAGPNSSQDEDDRSSQGTQGGDDDLPCDGRLTSGVSPTSSLSAGLTHVVGLIRRVRQDGSSQVRASLLDPQLRKLCGYYLRGAHGLQSSSMEAHVVGTSRKKLFRTRPRLAMALVLNQRLAVCNTIRTISETFRRIGGSLIL